jgi:hypothetical protein
MAGAQSLSGARPSNISTTGPTATQEKEPPYGSHWKTMPRTPDLTGRPTATQEKEPPYGSHWKTMPRTLDLTGSRHRYQHFLMLPLFLVLMHSVYLICVPVPFLLCITTMGG